MLGCSLEPDQRARLDLPSGPSSLHTTGRSLCVLLRGCWAQQEGCRCSAAASGCSRGVHGVLLRAAWNLINEPRSDLPSGPADIQSWIATVAPYVKALAPNQLVTVGEDGFYQKSNCQSNTCALALWLFKDPGDLKSWGLGSWVQGLGCSISTVAPYVEALAPTVDEGGFFQKPPTASPKPARARC